MTVASLTFCSRYGNITPIDVAGGIELRGEVEWIVEGDETAITTLLRAVSRLGSKASTRSAILRFGNVVGCFDLGEFGFVRVRCGKLGEDVFDGMLDDLTQKLAALPFSASQTAGIPHDRSIADRDDVLLHAFIYARHALLAAKNDRSLIQALDLVVRDPHRLFHSERAAVGLAVASRIDTRTIIRIVAGAGARVRAPDHLASGALARALGGCVPEYVDVPRVRDTYDSAENRFVLETLKQLRAIIDRVERLARNRAKPSTFWFNTLADCAAMRRALAPIERHPMWNEVHGMDHMPLGSTVLQRRRGYKDVLRHYLTMRAAARIPVDKNTLTNHLLGLKDVATLYEMWCYFTVVDVASQVLHRAPDVADVFDVEVDKVIVGRGFLVAWSGGPSLHYNPPFTAKKPSPWRSASLMLRPDIVIELERDGQVELHVFDAKLKVDGIALDMEDVVNDEGLDDSTDEAVDPPTFERDDVAKMHTYRDALPHVRSARVLYPGDDFREFNVGPGTAGIDVVGAIPLVPRSARRGDLIRVLQQILGASAAHSVAGSRPETREGQDGSGAAHVDP